jgi:23S rRNA (cytosine1962-C5)-methyltransferase
MVPGSVILKRRRAKPILQRHPWVFSGAIARVDGNPAAGDIVEVRDAGGNWIARGSFNPRSQIVVRILTWDQHEDVDLAFWQRRLDRAILSRRSLAADGSTSAYRLVHAESDYLPGLIVDRYGECLVVQFLTLGVERWREDISGLLTECLSPQAIYERSDVDARDKEGLRQRTGLLYGKEPAPEVEILQHGHRFLVDVRRGQKTGFYLDQRANRARLAELVDGREVLDVFSYTGGFAVHVLGGGATRVTLVDSSASALALARRNLALNDMSRSRFETVEGDAFSVLRGLRAKSDRFDLVVLDPPKLARTRRDVGAAARAYKDINLLGFQLLRPGGLLVTTSCSGAVSADLFQKIVFGALIDSGCDGQIVGHLNQSADHPVALTFPEGAYLKGLIVLVA